MPPTRSGTEVRLPVEGAGVMGSSQLIAGQNARPPPPESSSGRKVFVRDVKVRFSGAMRVHCFVFPLTELRYDPIRTSTDK